MNEKDALIVIFVVLVVAVVMLKKPDDTDEPPSGGLTEVEQMRILTTMKNNEYVEGAVTEEGVLLLENKAGVRMFNSTNDRARITKKIIGASTFYIVTPAGVDGRVGLNQTYFNNEFGVIFSITLDKSSTVHDSYDSSDGEDA